MFLRFLEGLSCCIGRYRASNEFLIQKGRYRVFIRLSAYTLMLSWGVPKGPKYLVT